MKNKVPFIVPLVPTGATSSFAADLELAARDAERRQDELEQEAATAETHYAQDSIYREARKHADRAARLRTAAQAVTETGEAITHLINLASDYPTSAATPEQAQKVENHLRALKRHMSAQAA